MDRQVAIAQQEPCIRAEPPEHLQRVISIAANTPALRLLDDARERVGDDVEVGRDIEAVQRDVVAGVDDGHDLFRRHDLHQSFEEAGRAHAARKRYDHGDSPWAW
jgi:hypothetical protein